MSNPVKLPNGTVVTTVLVAVSFSHAAGQEQDNQKR